MNDFSQLKLKRPVPSFLIPFELKGDYRGSIHYSLWDPDIEREEHDCYGGAFSVKNLNDEQLVSMLLHLMWYEENHSCLEWLTLEDVRLLTYKSRSKAAMLFARAKYLYKKNIIQSIHPILPNGMNCCFLLDCVPKVYVVRIEGSSRQRKFRKWIFQNMGNKGYLSLKEAQAYPFEEARAVTGLLQGMMYAGYLLKIKKYYFLPPESLILSWSSKDFRKEKSFKKPFCWSTHISSTTLVKYYQKEIQSCQYIEDLNQVRQKFHKYQLPKIYGDKLLQSYQNKKKSCIISQKLIERTQQQLEEELFK